jgi:hypothetical protein
MPLPTFPGETAAPFYTYESCRDVDAVGVGVGFYALEGPGATGLFTAEVRIMLKWHLPGIEEKYKRASNEPRTPIEISDKKGIRMPNFALNTADVETTAEYGYIDQQDPHDVVTLQRVLKGSFSADVALHAFPADVQKLPLRFRMWDSNPDDRCRYFRLLQYCDGTPWFVGSKTKISAIEFKFQQPMVEIGTDELAKTSYLEVAVPCVRCTNYYLRQVCVRCSW